MRIKVGATLLLILALAVPLVWAQDLDDPPTGRGAQMARFFRGEHDQGHMWMRFLEDPAFRQHVGITNEQADKLRALGFAAAKTRARLEADGKIRRIELTELLRAEKPDRAAIDKKLREIADIQYASLKAHTDDLLAFREIVPPEQREKIHAFVRDRMRERMREFRGPRPGMMGPGMMDQPGPRGPREPGAPPPQAPPKETPKDN